MCGYHRRVPHSLRSFPTHRSSGLVASALAVKACHEAISDAQIGCMLDYIPAYPLTSAPEDVFAALQGEREILMFGDTINSII
ncbi:glycosyl hydrolase family protein [Paenibacillus sp. 28ISP30-2]|nr:glycosyl hydrolase family protein [Paenibacillus sp. 28ISP30-2]